jgi:molecular chaperone DnaK
MTVFGIDLGTTNSVIAQLVDGVPRAIPVEGDPIMPSVVLYAADGHVLVGREARNLALAQPERVVRSIKRQMGRAATITVGGRELRPEAVSAEILRALARAATSHCGEPVREVVITVPAYFDDAQRRATLEAGKLAGLEVLRLLNEPTAAALVYDHVGADSSTELMLVYDLGGGTFDVSLLELLGDIREVRSTSGDTQLGGDDFDALLVEHFAARLRDDGVEQLDVATMARLQRAAETTKIALSRALELEVREEFVATRGGKPAHLRCTVTRSEFEAMIADRLDSTIALARAAIEDAHLRSGERLGKICLVGGSTRIPRVRDLLTDAFDVDIHEVDVDLAVALGAAVQGAMLEGRECRRVLVDVAAHTLGIRAIGDSTEDIELMEMGEEPDTCVPILARNTVLPGESMREMFTSVDDQLRADVDVFQGESRRCSENKLVGSFTAELRPAPAASSVYFRIAYDLDGVVRVTVSQPGGPEQVSVMQLPDAAHASRKREPSSALAGSEPSVSESAVLRRARKLAARLEGKAKAELDALIARCSAASPSEREGLEDALLDALLALEEQDG